MVLKSLEVYDHTLSLRFPCREFYAELFLNNTPKDIMENLRSAGWTRPFTEVHSKMKQVPYFRKIAAQCDYFSNYVPL